MKANNVKWIIALSAAVAVLLVLKYGKTLEAAYASAFTCQNEIRKSLHDPSSAQFSSDQVREVAVWNWKSTGKIQRATWTVRAKNRLGNYVSENMTCWFDEDGNFQRVTSS